MSDEQEYKPAVNTFTATTAIGLGLALAPFTGGTSLIYTGCCLSSWALIDLYTGGKTIPANKDTDGK